jgi:MFS transporter, DHA1 family, tetracycline resistance protein
MSGNDSQAKKLLLPVFLTVFIDLLGATIVLPILAPLFLDFEQGILPIDVAGWSLAAVQELTRTRTITFGLLIAIFPLAQFFGAPLLGSWGDRIGRKKVLLISLVGTLIGYILFAIGIRYNLIWLLFVARALDGFTGGNISIVFSAISDISTKETKTKNFGLVGMAFGLGFIIGPFLGGVLSDHTIVSWFNFETPFWFSAMLCLVNIVLVILYFFETLKTQSVKALTALQGIRTIGKAFGSLNLRTIFLVSFFLTFGFSLFTQFLQVFLIQKFSFRPADIGKYFAFIGLFIAITQGLLTRFLSKHVRSENIVACTTLGLSLALMIYIIPNDATYLYFLAPLIAINQGLLSPNLQTLVSNNALPEEQGEILGINQSVQSLGQAIPPIIAGFVVAMNIKLPIILSSVFTFVAFLIFIIFYYKRKKT